MADVIVLVIRVMDHHRVSFMSPPAPRTTLFPYTTLFRSWARWRLVAEHHQRRVGLAAAVDDDRVAADHRAAGRERVDRKSTRLNSSHQIISYAVFCLKKKNCRVDLARRYHGVLSRG